MAIRFSIIICTYNPDVAIFTRLLKAIISFTGHDSPAFEVIIVDNNSRQPVSEMLEVKSFQSLVQGLTFINESRPGLTSARVAGIKEAKHNWVIFFDDDNEPCSDFLNLAKNAIDQYPQVGTWGPGEIEVVYTENNDHWLETKKGLFQHRNETNTLFSRKNSWQSCYPFGTGMIIKTEIAKKYALRVLSGQYTLSDRKGKTLASGGDVQLVLTGIEMGYAAGTIAGVCLNHLINSSKADFSYMQKLQYGTASAYIKAYNQVFQNNQINTGNVNNYSILRKIYSLYRIYGSQLNKKDFRLLVASKLGEMNASIVAKGKSKPVFLKWYERIIHA